MRKIVLLVKSKIAKFGMIFYSLRMMVFIKLNNKKYCRNFVIGRRWYRILQHYSGAAAPEVDHEPGQRFSREMPIPNTRQSSNERSNPRGHAAVSTASGNDAIFL